MCVCVCVEKITPITVYNGRCVPLYTNKRRHLRNVVLFAKRKTRDTFRIIILCYIIYFFSRSRRIMECKKKTRHYKLSFVDGGFFFFLNPPTQKFMKILCPSPCVCARTVSEYYIWYFIRLLYLYLSYREHIYVNTFMYLLLATPLSLRRSRVRRRLGVVCPSPPFITRCVVVFIPPRARSVTIEELPSFYFYKFYFTRLLHITTMMMMIIYRSYLRQKKKEKKNEKYAWRGETPKRFFFKFNRFFSLRIEFSAAASIRRNTCAEQFFFFL